MCSNWDFFSAVLVPAVPGHSVRDIYESHLFEANSACEHLNNSRWRWWWGTTPTSSSRPTWRTSSSRDSHPPLLEVRASPPAMVNAKCGLGAQIMSLTTMNNERQKLATWGHINVREDCHLLPKCCLCVHASFLFRPHVTCFANVLASCRSVGNNLQYWTGFR